MLNSDLLNSALLDGESGLAGPAHVGPDPSRSTVVEAPGPDPSRSTVVEATS